MLSTIQNWFGRTSPRTQNFLNVKKFKSFYVNDNDIIVVPNFISALFFLLNKWHDLLFSFASHNAINYAVVWWICTSETFLKRNSKWFFPTQFSSSSSFSFIFKWRTNYKTQTHFVLDHHLWNDHRHPIEVQRFQLLNRSGWA